jgi:hypothetical protein
MSWTLEQLPPATALIAAVSAIIGGLVAAAIKFAFDFYLSEWIKRRWRTIDTKRKYSAQIIRAADDLAGRLSNLNRQLAATKATKWLRPIDEDKELPLVPFKRYYYSSTLYLICRLIAWIEVLKREQIFLDFASSKETRQFNCYLDLVYSVLSYSALTSDQAERESKNHWIYLHYLEGVGESLFVKDSESGELRCLTFHEFCEKYKRSNASSEFRGWIREIEKLITSLSNSGDDFRWSRLQMLWLCLDRFLDFADPKKLRTTRGRIESNNITPSLREAVLKQAKWHHLKF